MVTPERPETPVRAVPGGRGAPAGATRTGGHSRLPGLDGVRGLAIVLVVLEHGGLVRPRAGGSGGVTIFFVLSGFLITRLLIAEWDRTGRISLTMFWLRRAVRLLPALWVFLGASGLALALLSWNRHPVAKTLLPTLFYYANYASQRHSLDYLAHTWSLSVEEQFYVLWPLLAILGFRFLPRHLLLVALAAVTVLGVVIRLHIGDVTPNGVQLKFSLEANSWALGLGATLAALIDRLRRVPRVPALVALVVAILGLDVIQHQLEIHHLTYINRTTGPFVFGTVGAVLLVCGLTTRRSWLTFPVLTWMGRRSYAWYLWHFPFVWANLAGHWSLFGRVGDGLLSAALGLAAAEVSWRLVEMPSQRLFHRWQRRTGEPTLESPADVMPADGPVVSAEPAR